MAGAALGATAQVSGAIRQDVSPPLRDLVDATRQAPVAQGPDREVRNRFEEGRLPRVRARRSRVIRSSMSRTPPVETSALTPAPSLSFEGTTDDDNAAVVGFRSVPPDTNGDVGLTHYAQMNNVASRSSTSDRGVGARAGGGQLLWAGFGGICQTNNDGDPIVLYDDVADRWVISQFANPTRDDGHQCVAVSTHRTRPARITATTSW